MVGESKSIRLSLIVNIKKPFILYVILVGEAIFKGNMIAT